MIKLKQLIKENVEHNKYYTTKSLTKIINDLGYDYTSRQISYCLKYFKNMNLCSYDKSNKLWIFQFEQIKHDNKNKQLDILETIFNRIEEFIETTVTEKIDRYTYEVINNTYNAVDKNITKIISDRITEKVADVIIKNNENIITTIVQKTVAEEFKSEVVPVLLTNIKDRINQELNINTQQYNNNINNIKEEINDIRNSILHTAKYLISTKKGN